MHNYLISNGDTDSITIYKEKQEEFPEEERKYLIEELNELSPSGLVWADDGYYPCMIVLKAKNYILWNGSKVKYKGSGLKSSTLEIALKEFLKEIIDSIIFERNNYTEIYHKYIKEALDIQDIKRWASKKTLSSTTYKSERTNETKIVDAIKGTEYVEGDRVYVYTTDNNVLKLVEHYNHDYDLDTYLKKVYNCCKRFATVLDKNLFINYSLKKNKKLLEDLVNVNC